MSTPGMNLQPYECPACQTQMHVEIPRPEIKNDVNYSMILLIHNRPEQCQNCKKLFTFVIISIDNGVQLKLVELRPQAQTNIVAPSAAEVVAIDRTKPRAIITPGGE